MTFLYSFAREQAKSEARQSEFQVRMSATKHRSSLSPIKKAQMGSGTCSRSWPIRFASTLAVACVVAFSCAGWAQIPAKAATIFTGRNVYSPSVEYDAESQLFKMWYGGWQTTSDYPHDKIYYRTSKDGWTWSSPRTVLTPSQLPGSNAHVNDPSVVKITNSVTRQAQYTMFYTVCPQPCTGNVRNQIWSSVSGDGLNWILHKPLIRTKGAAVPSAILSVGQGPSIWTVYYSNTNDSPSNVFMAEVDGNRNVVTKDAVVYTWKGPGFVANPEVRSVGGAWNLIFNVYHTRRGAKRITADVYVTQSSNHRFWRGGLERTLILNDPDGEVCATVAPAILPLGDRFLLQFSEARHSASGVCDFSTFETMRQLIVGSTSTSEDGTGSLRPTARCGNLTEASELMRHLTEEDIRDRTALSTPIVARISFAHRQVSCKSTEASGKYDYASALAICAAAQGCSFGTRKWSTPVICIGSGCPSTLGNTIL